MSVNMASLPHTFCMVGAGNVATHLASALCMNGYKPLAVWSRSEQSAQVLADKISTEAFTDYHLMPEADLYIYSVSDAVLPGMVRKICPLHPHSFHIHTSGSTPLSVFPEEYGKCGVLYPLQTFSKKRVLKSFREIPLFVEAADDETLKVLLRFSGLISDRVYALDSAHRRYLHLAAVFACNFSNCCYAMAAQCVEAGAGVPFDVLLPLITETAAKVHELSPRDAQTGPAIRMDRNILDAHLALLKDKPHWAELYTLLSEQIHRMCHAEETVNSGDCFTNHPGIYEE